MDIPRVYTVRERDHRIHNPFSAEKLAVLGRAIGLRPGMRLLDLGSGSGELLCTWARDHGITGLGVDLSADFTARAVERAEELGVSTTVTFRHDDATGFVADEPVDVAACLGATWIGGGVAGTVELLERSLRPGGTVLIGHPYWLRLPEDEATARACGAEAAADFLLLPGLLEQFAGLGLDVVELVLADRDSWDRYVAAQWLTTRRWLDAHPDDELAGQLRAELDTAPARYARYQREYLGWGVVALIRR